jgi:hypothetical protein
MADRTVLLVTHGAHANISNVFSLDRGRLVAAASPAQVTTQ